MYGSQLRFAHAFVMSILFGKGPITDRFRWSVRMALSHGKILALFAFTYKLVQCILANLRHKACASHSFVAGVAGSSMLLLLRTEMSINRQVCYYLAARVLEGVSLKMMKQGLLPDLEAYQKVYSLVWALVMFLFELDKSTLNGSLVSSMNFLYKQSDRPLASVTELVPLGVPDSVAGIL